MTALCEWCGDGPDDICERCRQRVEITHLRAQVDAMTNKTKMLELQLRRYALAIEKLEEKLRCQP